MKPRKVWSDKLLGLLTCCFAAGAESAASGNAAAFAQTFPLKQCHLENFDERSSDDELALSYRAPNYLAKGWKLFFPSPPSSLRQRCLASSLFLDGSSVPGVSESELSPEHRIVLVVQTPDDDEAFSRQVSARAKYRMLTYARRLVAGPPDSAVTDLSKEWHQRYLAPSATIDFQDAKFVSWLNENGLHRAAAERDVDFAWRAFLLVRKKYSYKFLPSQNRQASNICSAGASDCGGLSNLLVSTFRANNIPARTLVGRWLKSGTNGEQCHVKSEFFANDIGWVPVEMSAAIEDKRSDAQQYFGQISSDFITFHCDPDMEVDSVWFGQKSIDLLQSPVFWTSGSGDLNDGDSRTTWTVR